MTAPLKLLHDAADIPGLARVRAAYPAFTISRIRHGWHGYRWTAVRKNSADPGLYALVTPHLHELRAALHHDQAASRGNLPTDHRTETP